MGRCAHVYKVDYNRLHYQGLYIALLSAFSSGRTGQRYFHSWVIKIKHYNHPPAVKPLAFSDRYTKKLHTSDKTYGSLKVGPRNSYWIRESSSEICILLSV